MAFKQGAGIAVFEPPTEEDIKEFDASVVSSEGIKSTNEESNDVIQKLFISNLLSEQSLSLSNKTISTSLKNLYGNNFGKVDIILPIYNNLQIVEPCLVALNKRTNWFFNLIIINDASDEKTTKWLDKLAESNPSITLIRNKVNRGFAASVNRGIRAGDGTYICLLNSDVIVTEGWLTKMLLALEADPRNKIVNPCTNNTAEIAVPMQPGTSYLNMARGLGSTSYHRYPEVMPTGFCMMFYRSLIDTLGYFDEGYGSYGEETDFWMRTITHVEKGEYVRWRAVLADDAYVFHERGSSFASIGASKQMSLRRAGNERFKSIWPEYSSWRQNFNLEKSMTSVRKEMHNSVLYDKPIYKIAFVVHSTDYCGGMRYIADIVNTLIERNVDAKVVLIKRTPKQKIDTLGELRVAPIIFEDPIDFINNFESKVFESGFVLAATNELVAPVADVSLKNTSIIAGLFSQSAEPLMATDKPQHDMYLESYDQIDYIITVSKWLKEYIEHVSKHENVRHINPGVDTRLFYPRDRDKGDDRPTLLLALNNSAPYRGVERGIKMADDLLKIAKKNNTEIRILAYGLISIKGHQGIVCLGKLSQSRLAELLGTEVDVFCDPAKLHSYGMPALEAVASKVPAVCWDNKGVHSVVEDGKNGLIFPEGTATEKIASEVYDILMKKSKHKFSFDKVQIRENAVAEFIYTMENQLGVWNPPRKINVITPHLRKHGGPTTILNIANGLKEIGHDVSLYTIHSDLNPEITNTAKVPIKTNYKTPEPCDITIVNSDNEYTNFFANLPTSKKKVMLKLSHNPRFKVLEEIGLQQDWDKIITSTKWLKDVCNSPTEGWDYPARSATRIGWVHYAHEQFNCPPANKKSLKTTTAPVVGTLIHKHPLKGTGIALKGIVPLKEKYEDNLIAIGVGEVPKEKLDIPIWLKYLYNLDRSQMANCMAQTDIWVVASLSEGLGRIALEAMSAGCAVVLTDTGAEFAVHKKNCYIIPKDDLNAITEAVQELLIDNNLRHSIQEGGYQTACQFADQAPYISNVNNILQEMFK